ncbi:MAG: retropepsin-like domain-containing protein [Phycisphaerales bacterium]|nr:retropepsin-like domain-containing protein [Phycisphaerales bacterium]
MKWCLTAVVAARLGGAAALMAQPQASFDAARPSALEVKRSKTGQLLVKVEVNGRDAGWFIFDTGAGVCVVSKSLTGRAEELGMSSAGEVDAVGVGGSKRSSKLFRAAALRVGPLTLKDHVVMETDLSFLTPHLGEEVSGVIGYGVLARCVAEIDVGAALGEAGGGIGEPRVSLFAPAGYALAEGAWTELSVEGRVPAVKARFEGNGGGREGMFRLDTGANGHVTFHEPAVRTMKLLEGREVRDAKLGGVGGFVSAKAGTIGWFELGGVRHENMPASFAIEKKGVFADADRAGNIGAELLRPFVVVIDYTNKRAAFVRRGGAAPAGG